MEVAGGKARAATGHARVGRPRPGGSCGRTPRFGIAGVAIVPEESPGVFDVAAVVAGHDFLIVFVFAFLMSVWLLLVVVDNAVVAYDDANADGSMAFFLSFYRMPSGGNGLYIILLLSFVVIGSIEANTQHLDDDVTFYKKS